MSKERKIANAVIKRLPRYLRTLEEMEKEGVQRTSSAELSERIGFTASQIRQDLNHFGCFGQQGYGYTIADLKEEINNILGLNVKYKLVVIGCGRMGEAIANYAKSYEPQFIVNAMFDNDPGKIGSVFCGLPVLDTKWLGEYVQKNDIDIAVLTVPAESAQDIATTLKDADIKGIWNFALTDLTGMGNIPVEDMHLSDSLRALTYHICNE